MLDALRNTKRLIPDANIHNNTQDVDPMMAVDLCNNVKCGKATRLSYNPDNDNRRKRRRDICRRTHR